MGDDVSFVPPDRDDLDFVLIVAGCKTACVDVSPFEGHPIRYITSEEDAEQLIADLRKD
ncbi:MAG: hypothetical protein JXO48_10335 [Deltaproteobacteria bacterium]|nr:hypothetical protein [Deltaproteobacteria bacterium]